MRGYYDVFVRTCAKNPSNIAVRYYYDGNYKNYTYSELYGVCEYLSQNLQQLECTNGIIGLISERNVITPCVIAAAHKCCTTFMFLSPLEDLVNVTKDIKFNVIIAISNKGSTAMSELFNKKPDKSVSVFELIIDFYSFEPHQQYCKQITEHSFIAMTSGSTGEPKHIQVPVQCIQPNIDDLTKIFNIGNKDVIYFSTPLTFDPSMIEILLACTTGASLLIAPEKTDILFPENKENSITFWQTTPSKFFQYSNADIKNKILSGNSSLKILALGGEPLNGIKRLIELKDKDNKTKIYTLYGVTEMSCWACVAEIDLNKIHTDREVPLGNCLSETQLIVEPCKDNKNTGNIILASKTRQCFIINKPDSREEHNSLKFVNTGDIAEVKNGIVYYRGRKDDIIKRFGHKINLQFIESTTMQCPRVKTCSCVWLPKPLLLVVYFSSETLSSRELSNFLKCKLDDKHWPDKLIRVNSLPTNSHGKMSKRIISKFYEEIHGPHTIDSLRAILIKEFEVILNCKLTYDEIKDKTFFSIGGTSFLAVSLCNKLSLGFPQFSKFILPYLLSQNHTIEEIILFTQNKVCNEELRPKKKIRNSKSDSDSNTGSSLLSNSKDYVKKVTNPVDFIILWNYDTGKCVDASPSLFQTAHNLHVTVGSHSGRVIVVDAIAGTLQGSISVKSRIEASVFCYQTPTMACGVVGTYNGTVVCFTLHACEEIWRHNVGAMIKSKATFCNGFIYVASYDGKVRCINATTGMIKHTIDIAEQAISADLVLAKNEYVLVGTLSGVCASVHTATNAVAWRGILGSPVFASPALYDNDKYVVFAEVNGEIHCRTVEKGIEIWKYQGAKGNIFSSIYIKDVDKLNWQMIFGCHDNNVYSINIKNFQPSLQWKSQVTSPVYSTPCGLTDKLVLAASTNGKLSVINSVNGMTVTEYQLPDETFSTPTVYDDYIFIGCRNDNLYSLKYISN